MPTNIFTGTHTQLQKHDKRYTMNDNQQTQWNVMVLNPHHDSLDTSCLSHNHDIIRLERQTTCATIHRLCEKTRKDATGENE